MAHHQGPLLSSLPRFDNISRLLPHRIHGRLQMARRNHQQNRRIHHAPPLRPIHLQSRAHTPAQRLRHHRTRARRVHHPRRQHALRQQRCVNRVVARVLFHCDEGVGAVGGDGEFGDGGVAAGEE